MSAATNPYQTPSANVGPNYRDLQNVGNAAAMRSEYLSHEAAIRSIGVLYFISAGIFLILVPTGLVMLAENQAAGIGMVAMSAICAALSIWMGIAVRRLNARVRFAVGITSAIGLFNLPIGTLINGYILYLVFGAKGKVVFSEEYARVREQTPEMKYQTPTFVKICVLLLLFLLALGLFAAVMAP